MKHLITVLVLLLIQTTPSANAHCGVEVREAWTEKEKTELLGNAIKEAQKPVKGPFNYSRDECKEILASGKNHYWTYRDCLPPKTQEEQDRAWGGIGFKVFCNHKAVMQEIKWGKARFISYLLLQREAYTGDNVPFGNEEAVACQAFREVWGY